MKKIILLLLVVFFLFSCKAIVKNADAGSFVIENYSNRVIEYIWVVPEGELYSTSKSINIGYLETFEIDGLKEGLYDIAIDFKDEGNSFNSKKNKNLCINIKKGIKTIWKISEIGEIIRE